MFKNLKKIIAAICMLSVISTVAGPTKYNQDVQTESNINQIVLVSKVYNKNIKYITVTNNESSKQSYTIVENLQKPFFIKENTTFTLEPNQIKKIDIIFTPTHEGEFNAKVEIINNYNETRKEINLKGYTPSFLPNEFIYDQNVSTNEDQEDKYFSLYNLSNFKKTVYIKTSNNLITKSFVKLEAFEQINLNYTLTNNHKEVEVIEFYDNGKLLGKTEIIINSKIENKKRKRIDTYSILKSELESINLSAKKGDSIYKSFKIKNEGNKTAKLKLKEINNQNLKISYPKEIKANSKATIKLTYKPTFNENKSELIQFETDATNTKILNIDTNLNAYGFENNQEELKISLDQKIYKLHKNQNLKAVVKTNQDILVNVQIKKNGVVITNLGTAKLFKDSENSIIWNKANIAGLKVENGTYQLVINAIADNKTQTISSKVIVGSLTSNKTQNKDIAYISVEDNQTIFTNQTNKTVAVIYPNCEFKYNLEINVLLPYQDSNQINGLRCNEIFEIKSPNEIKEGEIKIQIKIKVKKEELKKEFNLTAKSIEDTIQTQSYRAKQTGLLASNLSQNIAYENQNLYLNFLLEKQGYLKAVVKGKKMKNPYNLALYKFYDKGTYLNKLKIPKNILKPGEYTVELEFTQNSKILKNKIKLVIIDKNSSLNSVKDECVNEYFCREDIETENIEDKNLNLNKNLTRKEAIELTVKLLGINSRDYAAYRDNNLSFSDLQNTNGPEMMAIKSNTVNQANNNEFTRRILEGYSNHEMKLNNNINRAEFYKIMFEALQNSKTLKLNLIIDYNQEEKPFFDTKINKDNQWFLPYAQLIKENFTNTTYAATYFNSFDLYNPKARFKASSYVSKEEAIAFIKTSLEKGIISN